MSVWVNQRTTAEGPLRSEPPRVVLGDLRPFLGSELMDQPQKWNPNFKTIHSLGFTINSPEASKEFIVFKLFFRTNKSLLKLVSCLKALVPLSHFILGSLSHICLLSCISAEVYKSLNIVCVRVSLLCSTRCLCGTLFHRGGQADSLKWDL